MRRQISNSTRLHKINTPVLALCLSCFPAFASAQTQSKEPLAAIEMGPTAPLTVSQISQLSAQTNLFRSLAAYPVLPSAQFLEIKKQHPHAIFAARFQAASAFLSIIDNGRPNVASTNHAVLGESDFDRLELMARRIVNRHTPAEREKLAQLAKTLNLASSTGSDAYSENPLAIKLILDEFFAESTNGNGQTASGKNEPTSGNPDAAGSTSKLDASLSPSHGLAARTDIRRPPSPSANEQYDLLSRVKKISKLQALAEKDPNAAIEYAARILRDPQERRAEVRISAMRALGNISSPEAFPIVRNELKNGKNWYLRREAARILGGMAQSLPGPLREKAVQSLSQAYQNEGGSKPEFENQSVRIMTHWALGQFGVEPREEPKAVLSEKTKPIPFYKQNFKNELWPKLRPYAGKALFVVIMLWVLGLFALIAGPALHLMPWASASESAAVETANKAGKNLAATPYFLDYLMYTFISLFVPFALGSILYGGYSIQKNWNKKPDRVEIPNVHFSDIAGIDDAAVEIQEIMDFLKNPKKYKHIGIHPPKGVLLVGPPGTGKTLLAKALAGESNSSFYQAVGSDFIEMYVGVGASRVRALFSNARNHSPAVIFIDEIDAVGGSRDGARQRNSEDDKTLTALLSEMDGFDNSKGVIIIAATNRPEALDPALKRPGRFDRMIHVSLPDKLGREAILQLHAAKVRLGADADLDSIAQRTPGLSGAFLENIINEAATLAARRGADAAGMPDLIEASDRQTVGQKRNFFISEEQKLKTARHEAGHALVEIDLGGQLDKLTIIPHGANSLGHARSASNEEEKYGYTKTELETRLAVLFGGLAAEELSYKQPSTGPGSDLEQATNIARMMVEQLGMGKRSGFEVHSRQGQQSEARPLSEKTKREIDLDVRDLLTQAYKKATLIIKSRKTAFENIVGALIEKETLTGQEVKEIALAAAAKPH